MPQAPIQPINKTCHYCVNNQPAVDYKDTTLLRKFMSSHAKIAPPRRSGCCTKHQRQMARAIKRARVMGLLPYVIK